jgi:hypothetical protein
VSLQNAGRKRNVFEEVSGVDKKAPKAVRKDYMASLRTNKPTPQALTAKDIN